MLNLGSGVLLDEFDTLHAKTWLWKSWNYCNHWHLEPIKMDLNYYGDTTQSERVRNVAMGNGSTKYFNQFKSYSRGENTWNTMVSRKQYSPFCQNFRTTHSGLTKLSLHTAGKHLTNLPWKKWPLFHRRCFQRHFHKWKVLYFVWVW